MRSRATHRFSTALAATAGAVVLFSLMGVAGAAGSSVAPLLPVEPDGERVYVDFCSACHQLSGEGLEEAIPPLIDSEWVEGDKGRLVRIIMHGVTGPIMVGGMEYSGMMAPLGQILDDAQIAAVATYVRTAWGNSASAVSTEDVASIRAQHGDRTTPWTARELSAIGSSSGS
jgi:mono/diheme cytochrome c family protein